MEFGQLLKEARKRSRYTLREVAKEVELSIGYISDIEHGRRKPPDSATIKRIAKFFDLRDDFLSEAAEKEKGVPTEARRIIMKNPEKMMALLRASENLSEQEINEWVERIEGVQRG